jgi:hypothetical protein
VVLARKLEEKSMKQTQRRAVLLASSCVWVAGKMKQLYRTEAGCKLKIDHRGIALASGSSRGRNTSRIRTTKKILHERFLSVLTLQTELKPKISRAEQRRPGGEP